MSDFVSSMADKFTASFEENSEETSKMEELEEQLQRLQQQRQAHRESQQQDSLLTPQNPRLSRRERLIRQTTQPRASERRSYSSTILQRTPVRSNSFEVPPVGVDEDVRNFRDRFETSRHNVFGRLTGSNESLRTSPRLGRRQSDTINLGTRGVGQVGSDSGSGSSTPTTYMRNPQDLAESLTSAILRSMESAEDSNVTSSTPSSQGLRNSTNTQRPSAINTSSLLNRTSARRERDANSRFRRRTIGVDRSVREALEIERRSTQDYSTSRAGNGTERKPDVLLSTTNSYSNYRPSSSRKIEIKKDETVPVLGSDDEVVIFVDPKGHVHWIRENRQLLRALKAKHKIPDIIVQNGDKSMSEEDGGFMFTLKEQVDDRYKQLNEHIKTLKAREANFEQDNVDSVLTPDMIEEKYKSVSLYTTPRPRQNIEKILASKKVASLYDGIKMETLSSDAPPGHIQIDMAEMLRSRQTDQTTYTLSIGHIQQAASRMQRQMNGTVQERTAPDRSTGETYNEWRSSLPVVDNSDIHQEFDLVMERLHGLGMTIDTSNLDFEEMRMIQMALEENPSPPETPHEDVHFDEAEYPYYNNIAVRDEVVLEPVEQTVIAEPIVELEESFQDESIDTANANEQSNSHTLQSTTRSPENQTMNTNPASNIAEEENTSELNRAEQEDISASNRAEEEKNSASNKAEEENNSVLNRAGEENTSVSNRAVPDSNFATIKTEEENSTSLDSSLPSEIPTHSAAESEGRKASPPTSLPSGRLPSQGATSPKLQMPSMDFSPLEKKSKKELDFSQQSQSQSGRVSDGSTSSVTRIDSTSNRSSTSETNWIVTEEEIVFAEEIISPTRKTNPDPMDRVNELLNRRNGETFTHELTVQVPSETEKVPISGTEENPSAETGERKDSLSVTTPVKSRSASSSNSGAVSPADSDTVTTTFEEFVAVIPREVLMQLKEKENSSSM